MYTSDKYIHDFDSLFSNYVYAVSGVTMDVDAYVSCIMVLYGCSSVVFCGGIVEAEVYDGVWQAVCPECNVATLPVSKSLLLCTCVKCYNVYSVNLREDWRSVEAILLKRPSKCNRNAITSDTIDVLLQENKDNL